MHERFPRPMPHRTCRGPGVLMLREHHPARDRIEGELICLFCERGVVNASPDALARVVTFEAYLDRAGLLAERQARLEARYAPVKKSKKPDAESEPKPVAADRLKQAPLFSRPFVADQLRELGPHAAELASGLERRLFAHGRTWLDIVCNALAFEGVNLVDVLPERKGIRRLTVAATRGRQRASFDLRALTRASTPDIATALDVHHTVILEGAWRHCALGWQVTPARAPGEPTGELEGRAPPRRPAPAGSLEERLRARYLPGGDRTWFDMTAMTARTAGVDVDDMLVEGRGTRDVTRARDALFAGLLKCGYSTNEVGGVFGRTDSSVAVAAARHRTRAEVERDQHEAVRRCMEGA